MRLVRRYGVAWLGLALLLAQAQAYCQEEQKPGNLQTLEALVGRWMDLRTTMAAERRLWEERREQWQQEIALLEEERAALRREIAQDRRQASSFEQERERVLARKEGLQAQLDELHTVLARVEARLLDWKEVVPQGLRVSMEPRFAALERAGRDARSPTGRARAVAALLTGIEQLHNGLHVTRETLSWGDRRQQMDVLYLGLARAFAVSPGNDRAAVGVPSSEGWIWTPCDERAEAFRRAIDTFERRETAALIDLPLQVIREVQP